jgi:tRNA (cytidine32/uridine32-2'-O)-methyltransferase
VTQIKRDIRIVLVEPSHPGNIGATARAMKTMGLDQLTLVRPHDFPSEVADQRAVAAVDILERALVVDSIEAAIGDCRLVVGTTGRSREYPLPALDMRDAATKLVKEATAGTPVAVLFGCERSGLSNEALDACTFQLRIPTGQGFSSLNLASAVQLVCYELLMAEGAAGEPEAAEREYPTQADLEFFFTRLRETLDDRNYFDVVNGTPTFTKIRRIFGRARLDVNELSLLHGLVSLLRRRD